MAMYYLYGTLTRLRVQKRFFHFMPEVRILNWLQDYYITSTHRKYQNLRTQRLQAVRSEPALQTTAR
jgi:hypothetical protein